VIPLLRSLFTFLRCATLSGRSNHSPYLSHLTPNQPQRRWYSSHIFGSKRLS
jgi:hypothetical protein